MLYMWLQEIHEVKQHPLYLVAFRSSFCSSSNKTGDSVLLQLSAAHDNANSNSEYSNITSDFLQLNRKQGHPLIRYTNDFANLVQKKLSKLFKEAYIVAAVSAHGHRYSELEPPDEPEPDESTSNNPSKNTNICVDSGSDNRKLASSALHHPNEAASTPRSYVLVHFSTGTTKHKLWQFDRNSVTEDGEFFKELRKEYRQARLRWLNLLPNFCTIARFKYVQFELLPKSAIWSSGFPPESEKDNYEPCGRALTAHPPPPEVILEHYYQHHSQIAPSWILDRIPKKLHRKLVVDGKKEVTGWGLHFEERIDYLRLTMIFGPPILLVLVIDAFTRKNLMRVIIFLTNTLPIIYSIYRLYTSQADRDTSQTWPHSYCLTILTDSRRRTLEEGSQNTDPVDGANKSESPDPEAQATDDEIKASKKSRKSGRLWQWRAWIPREKGDDPDENEDPIKNPGSREEDDDAGNLTEVIPICVYDGSAPLPRLIQIPAKQCHSDLLFFKALRNLATRRQFYSWFGLLTWCGLWRVVGIHYVKFELFPDDRVQILGKPEYPPSAMESSYRPTDTTFRSSSTAGLPQTLNSNAFVDFYQDPSALVGSTLILQRVIHKIDGQLCATSSTCVGYGLEVEEGFDGHRLDALRFVLVFLSVSFGLGWSLKTGDIQSGFAIGGGLAILASALVPSNVSGKMA